MEAERAAELKQVLPKLALGILVVESFTLPIFRSGGRTDLTFWGWVVNHTIFGPPVEYVPEEDYTRELEGAFTSNPVKENIQAFISVEKAAAYFQGDADSVEDLVNTGAISIVADHGRFSEFYELMAKVRHDGKYHSIKSLVQPDDPTVREVARVLVQADDFIKAAQEFVDSFTTYQREVGDYWTTPSEILAARAGDCDDKAILLVSILRNYLPADQVYCGFGLWDLDGEITGHMYVVIGGADGEDRIIEATAGPERKTRGKYILHGMFNDKYAFSTEIGIREFDLKTIEVEELTARR